MVCGFVGAYVCVCVLKGVCVGASLCVKECVWLCVTYVQGCMCACEYVCGVNSVVCVGVWCVCD